MSEEIFVLIFYSMMLLSKLSSIERPKLDTTLLIIKNTGSGATFHGLLALTTDYSSCKNSTPKGQALG